MDEAVTEPAEGTAVSANATVPSAPIAEYGTAKPMDLGRLKRLTAAIPDEAELHGYLHSWGVTIQAEWVADGEDGRQIMTPRAVRDIGWWGRHGARVGSLVRPNGR